MRTARARHPAPFERLVHFLALGFGAGAAPVAPGTFGTLMGIPVFLLLREVHLGLAALVILLMFGVGVWICGYTERALGRHDHPAIVWDEITALQVTLFAVPSGWGWIIYGFVLFRLFDIWKPWPLRAIERQLRSGLGTMLDDIGAGLYAFLVLQATYLVLRQA